MSSYITYSITTREELKEWILEECGSGLQTIEITDNQLDGCINTALETYTKWHTGPTRYLALQLSAYDETTGFDLSSYRVSAIEDIEDDTFGLSSDSGQLWTMKNSMEATGMLPFGYGAGGQNQGLAWVSAEIAGQYTKLAKRQTASYWDYEFNRHTGSLKLIPNPITVGADLNQFLCISVEVVEPLEELYGNEFVKMLALARSMIVVGRVRKKFESIQLLGGGQVDTSIGEEGQELWDKLIEKIREQEGPSFGCIIA